MKNAKSLFSLAAVVLLLSGASAVRGQSALDGFDPRANDRVWVVVAQPDGKVLLGGSFTALSPNNGGLAVARNHIARLNPDRTLDLAFNPDATGIVYAIAVQADGKVLVGGDFTTIGGQTRHYIARLDATTGVADSFDPNANNGVRSVAVQADGQILVGGLFNGANSIGRTNRNYIARLDASSGLADSFNPDADSYVLSLAVQADHKILAGGGFGSIGGQIRNSIARLDATNGLADTFNPNANGTVYSIAQQADGKVLAGGSFTSIGGATRNHIARLDAVSGMADSFDPNANGDVRSIAVQADGRILAGGYFTMLSPNGGLGVGRNRMARFNPDGTLDPVFNPSANADVLSIAVQADGGTFFALAPNGGTTVDRFYIARLETDGRPDQTLDLNIGGSFIAATAVQADGKILIGGGFTNVLGVARNNIARLNTDGTLDTAFDPNASVGVFGGGVYAIAVQPDGKILAGGNFTAIGGQTRHGIARLDATTGAADSFDAAANNTVTSIAVQADGKVLLGGGFTALSPNGGLTVARNHIARLNVDGTVDTNFNANASGIVYAIAVQPDGKILVGGYFNGANSIGGQTRNHIARLDPATGSADSFNPDAHDPVLCIAVQADGKILAGGLFNGIGDAIRNHIARLDAVSGLGDSFDPDANGTVNSIAVQADGKILAGGNFNGIGGASRRHIARLFATDGLADSFFPELADIALSIAVQADGKILAGGYFTSIGGQARNYFARLANDTAALQSLEVTKSGFFTQTKTIRWTRGGSSPQFTRVTFESSADNVNYEPLGDGTATGNTWTFNGLSLPTAPYFYIRARGYYRSGWQNGSESITEFVRAGGVTQLPEPAQPLLNVQRSVNTDVVLSWDTNFTGFTLEANTNLATNVWSTVSPSPVVSGTNNVVTNAPSGSARFYRLRK